MECYKFVCVTVLLVCCVACSLAHVCLLSPTQRGIITSDINKPGATDCIHLNGPCGGMKPVIPPSSAISSGYNISVVFQKNLNHYNKDRPGYFSIKIGPNQGSLTEVKRIPDDLEKSLSLYNTLITAPKDAGYYVLQVEYFTNNAQAPPAFYQCSDFIVFPPIAPSDRPAALPRKLRYQVRHENDVL